MTAANHAVTGALIAVLIKQPVVALPLAVASHYVLDALPHFGYPNQGGFGEALKYRLAYFDIAWSLIGLVLLAIVLRHQGFWVYFAALLAIAPDLMWPYRYFWFERKNLAPPGGLVTRWHSKMQWCERPWGIVVELLWFGIFITLLARLV